MVMEEKKKRKKENGFVKNSWCQINLISSFATVACLVNKKEAANAIVLDSSDTFWHIWQAKEYGIAIITTG